MREIKVRFWDKKLNIMWEPIELKKLLSYLLFQSMPNSDGYIALRGHFEEMVPLQFTELMDFKNKEIYEGDFVEIIGDEFYSNDVFSIDRTEDESWKIVGEVCMSGFMWIVEMADKTWIPFFDIVYNDFEFNIIGNLYETPELIGKP